MGLGLFPGSVVLHVLWGVVVNVFVPSRWLVGGDTDGWHILYDRGTVSQPQYEARGGTFDTEIDAFMELPHIMGAHMLSNVLNGKPLSTIASGPPTEPLVALETEYGDITVGIDPGQDPSTVVIMQNGKIVGQITEDGCDTP